MTTSGFFNTNNPAPEDLKSAAEILAGALAAAEAVAGDSQAAASAAEAAQDSATAAAGSAAEAAGSLASIEAAGAAAEAARVAAENAAEEAARSAQEAEEKAAGAASAAAQSVITLGTAQVAKGAAEAARDLAQGYRDSASEYAADAAAAQAAAAASASSAAGSATAAASALDNAMVAAGEAGAWSDVARDQAAVAASHVEDAEGFADLAQSAATAASGSAGAAMARANDAANSASAAAGSATTASSAATIATEAAGSPATDADAAEASALAAAESAADAAAAAEAASGGGIKISVTDTTPELLDASVTVSGGLTKAVANPGGNERLALGLNAATTSAQGAMSAADKVKLDGFPVASSIATREYADNAAAAAVAAVVDAAPAELNTLREIAEHLADAEDTTAGLISAVALKADKTYVDTEVAGRSPTGHTHSFASLTSRPTTLAGYGITDAAPSAHLGAGDVAHATATTTTAGFMAAADKVKLSGIAAGAQVNSVTCIFGRMGAVAAANGDYTAAQITNTPAGSISSTTVQAAISELDGKKADAATVTTTLAGKSNAGHTHNFADLTGALTFATQPPGDNSTAVATTEFVQSAVVASTAGVASFNTRTGSVFLTAADVRTALGGTAIQLVPNAPPTTSAGGTMTLSASPGGSTSGNGGNMIIGSGSATDGQGGLLNLMAGNGGSNTSTARNGGRINVNSGNGVHGGMGGLVYIKGGNGGSAVVGGTSAHGGNVDLNAGNSGSTGGNGGSINLTAGSGTASHGDVKVTVAPGGNIVLMNLPASMPSVANALWNDSGTLKITS